MKKIMSVILAVLYVALFGQSVFASSFYVGMSGDTTFDSSTTITVTAGGFSGFDMTYGGLCVFSATLSYDSSKISVTPSPLNGFNLTYGSKVVLDRASGVSDGSGILSLYVVNIGLNGGESTTISLGGITGSDGSNDIAASSVSKTISLVGGSSSNNQETQTTQMPQAEGAKNDSGSVSRPQNNDNEKTDIANDQSKDESKDGDKKESDEKEDKSYLVINEREKTKDESEGVQKRNQVEDNSNVVLLLIIAGSLVAVSAGTTVLIIKKKKKNKKQ